jgi:hypothetical protein
VTVVTYRSAAGHFELPLLEYPRIDITAELVTDGAAPDTTVACYESGWMQSESFTQWFQQFISHVKPTRRV